MVRQRIAYSLNWMRYVQLTKCWAMTVRHGKSSANDGSELVNDTTETSTSRCDGSCRTTKISDGLTKRKESEMSDQITASAKENGQRPFAEARCSACGRELIPAAARWDGELTTVGYRPCRCSREMWLEHHQGETYPEYLNRINQPRPCCGRYDDQCDCEPQTQGRVW